MVGNILRWRNLVNDGMLYSISKKGHDMMDVELGERWSSGGRPGDE
jgi:hypothetical protein